MGDGAGLTQKFEHLGVSDPEGWARSERDEGIAQLARATFLHAVWADMERWRRDEWVERWADEAATVDVEVQRVVRSMLEAGIPSSDVATLAAAVAREAAFGVLFRIDEGGDVDLGADFPGWLLVEVDGATEHPTGREVGGLHESLLSR